MYFTKSSRCILYGTHLDIAQNMLDYDYLCGRGPSVAAFFSQHTTHKHKLFYGNKEILIPTINDRGEINKFSNVDTLINLASFRSCTLVNKEALATKQFKQIFTIAEGVAENETRELIALAQKYNTTMFGPSVVGGLISGIFRIGHTGGSLENIIKSKLHIPGSIAIVSKSGGMMNELCRVASKYTDGVHTALQVGGDRFPMTTFKNIMQYYEEVDDIKMIIMLGEVGNKDEIEIANMIKNKEITKPVVARCIGTSAEKIHTNIQFGHAGAKANSEEETATYKNTYLGKSGAYVPDSYDKLGSLMEKVFFDHIKTPKTNTDTLHLSQEILDNLKYRHKTRFTSTITDERGEELMYNNHTITDIVAKKSLSKVIGYLWLKKDLPKYACNFIDTTLILLADHGPAVSGAVNTIVSARAGKDLVSSLIAGLATIGPRFGGAIDDTARRLHHAICNNQTAEEIILYHKEQHTYIPGIGHKIKSKYNPDKRCKILEDIAGSFPQLTYLYMAKSVEKLTLQKKANLILNVDGYVAALLLDMLTSSDISPQEIQQYVNVGLGNGIFILARSIGLIGHYLDQKRLDEGLYRAPGEDILYDINGS